MNWLSQDFRKFTQLTVQSTNAFLSHGLSLELDQLSVSYDFLNRSNKAALILLNLKQFCPTWYLQPAPSLPTYGPWRSFWLFSDSTKALSKVIYHLADILIFDARFEFLDKQSSI